MIEHYLTLVEPLIIQYGYFAVFGAIFVESFGMPTPGQSILVGASVLAAKKDLSLPLILLLAWTASIVGDNVGYAIGRYGGRRLLLKFRINERHLVRVESVFAHYGGGVVAAARFFDGLRQLNGLVAGTLEMPWREFLAYNALGATLWVSVWGVGAYVVDRHLEAFLAFFHRFEPIVVAVGLLAIGLVVAYLFWRPGRDSRA